MKKVNFLIAFLVVGAFFIIPKISKASVLLDCSGATGTDRVGNAAPMEFSGGELSRSTSTPDVYIGSISARVKVDASWKNLHPTYPLYISLNAGSNYYLSDAQTYADFSTTYEYHIFIFSGANRPNITINPVFLQSFFGSGDAGSYYMTVDSGLTNTCAYSVSGQPNNNIIVYDEYGVPIMPTIGFSLPYKDGMTTTDFKNWWLKIYIPETSTITGYYWEVTYGTSTPYGVTDSLKTQFGILPKNINESINEAPFLSKTATTTAGTYQAEATLYDRNNNVVARSDVINFIITGGEIQNYALGALTNENATQNCNPTNFSLFGVDFGVGVCNLVRFLFVPSQNSVNQFLGTQSIMATKPPFNFFYNLTSTLSGLASTTASTTMTGLTLSVGATSTPFHITADMFSADTINKYTNTTSRNLLRTIMEYSIYLGFTAMVILEVRQLFKKDGGAAK